MDNYQNHTYRKVQIVEGIEARDCVVLHQEFSFVVNLVAVEKRKDLVCDRRIGQEDQKEAPTHGSLLHFRSFRELSIQCTH